MSALDESTLSVIGAVDDVLSSLGIKRQPTAYAPLSRHENVTTVQIQEQHQLMAMYHHLRQQHRGLHGQSSSPPRAVAEPPQVGAAMPPRSVALQKEIYNRPMSTQTVHSASNAATQMTRVVTTRSTSVECVDESADDKCGGVLGTLMQDVQRSSAILTTSMCHLEASFSAALVPLWDRLRSAHNTVQALRQQLVEDGRSVAVASMLTRHFMHEEAMRRSAMMGEECQARVDLCTQRAVSIETAFQQRLDANADVIDNSRNTCCVKELVVGMGRREAGTTFATAPSSGLGDVTGGNGQKEVTQDVASMDTTHHDALHTLLEDCYAVLKETY